MFPSSGFIVSITRGNEKLLRPQPSACSNRQNLHVLKVASSYLGVTSHLSQSEIKVCWEEGGGEERATEARRNPTPTPQCSLCRLPPHSEKHMSAPENWKTKHKRGLLCGARSHLRIEVFVIGNKVKTKRHLLNTRVGT